VAGLAVAHVREGHPMDARHKGPKARPVNVLGGGKGQGTGGAAVKATCTPHTQRDAYTNTCTTRPRATYHGPTHTHIHTHTHARLTLERDDVGLPSGVAGQLDGRLHGLGARAWGQSEGSGGAWVHGWVCRGGVGAVKAAA
jgi:hypothetical protein